MKPAPIVLFVYNRPYHTRQTVEALRKNELASESELFIYSDAPKNSEAKQAVKEVREYIRTIDGFKKVTIIEREKNWGLAANIIDGVTKIVNEYGKIIVLEDDLVTSPYFLKFMNEALIMYENDSRVASIHGYIYPIEGLPLTFFIKGADCWGWATWKRAWEHFEKDGQKLLDEVNKRNLQKEIDFNGMMPYVKMLQDQIVGKNNSWAVRWHISAFLKDMLTLYPSQTYVQNIGLDNSGTHCKGGGDIYTAELCTRMTLNKIEIKEDLYSKEKMALFFKSVNKNTYYEKIKSLIQKVLR